MEKRSSTIRIDVSGSRASDVGPLRAYAEYRVFTQLAAFAQDVHIVRVSVRRSDDGTTSCVMNAELCDGAQVQTRSRDTRPIAAVDSAAKKLAEQVCGQTRPLTE
jgi:ribosome-associated translation inhibitor RaiA